MADPDQFSARRWAVEMTKLWSTASVDRFPVDVEAIALEVSRVRYPDDRIRAVKAGHLPGFEGALYPLGDPGEGWAIIFNETGVSVGRRRFTVAHEFGHYLAHRRLRPDGIQCDERSVSRRDGQGIEKEADEFAAWLLMPLDDFRAQIPPLHKAGLDEIRAAASRYGVSVMAAMLRWLEYTERRAVFVVSRDGGALWARSSEAAFRSGRYIRTAGEPFMLPDLSCAALAAFDQDGLASALHPPGVWFPEAVEETSFYSKTYEMVFTLLHLPKAVVWSGHSVPEEPDTFDRFTRGR